MVDAPTHQNFHPISASALEFDHSVPHQAQAYADWRDRLLLSLAVANAATLTTLLTHCNPAIAIPSQVGSIRLQVSLPLASGQLVDGVIEYEQLYYVLDPRPGDRPEPSGAHPSQAATAREATHDFHHHAGYTTLTRCQSQLQTLAKSVTYAQALAMLTAAGFSSPDVHAILTLPSQAWHKSWWYPVTANGAWGLPFQRFLRSRHHPNGTYTLQYRDHFAQEAPNCFRSRTRRVLLTIHNPSIRFGDSLAQINQARYQAKLDAAILLSPSIALLCAQGFMHQGIRIYSHCPICPGTDDG